METDNLDWDYFPDWDNQKETEARPTNLLPPGKYTARVIKAEATYRERVPEKWLAANPDGRQLTLKLAIKHEGQEYHVYVDLAAHWRGQIERVCDALGAPRPAKGTTWSTRFLVGKTCRVETSLYEGRRVNVDRWFRRHVDRPEPGDPRHQRRSRRRGLREVEARRSQRRRRHPILTKRSVRGAEIPVKPPPLGQRTTRRRSLGHTPPAGAGLGRRIGELGFLERSDK